MSGGAFSKKYTRGEYGFARSASTLAKPLAKTSYGGYLLRLLEESSVQGRRQPY